MEITINLDLPGIIAQACSAERLQPLVDKAIAEALKSAIAESTGYHSEFRKAMSAQLTEALPHGLRVSELTKFQHVLNDAINRHVHGANSETVATALGKVVKDALPEVPPVVKLSELIQITRDGFHKEQHEAFYAYWEPSHYGGGGWLYLDGSERPRQGYGSPSLNREEMKYSAEHRIAVNKEGDVYALRLGGKDVTPAARPDVIGNFESTLMAMYVGRTRLEIDWDDDDVCRAAQEQYD